MTQALKSVLLFAVLALCIVGCGRNPTDRAIDQILDLYDRYDLVHLGERHWNMTDYEFRLALINDPRFVEVVDDIVIEAGNNRYQDVLDAYILELDDIPDSILSQVWRNTVVVSGVWNGKIYKEFVRAVRQANENLPRADRIRLLATDPPIDWTRVRTFDDWWSFLAQRSTYAPQVIKTEITDRGRKAFIIYGGAHFYRSGGPTCGGGNLGANIESVTGRPLFTIQPTSGDSVLSRNFEAAIGSSEYPQFVNLKGSDLAVAQARDILFDGSGRLGDFTDGVLYLGPGPDLETIYDPEAWNDSAYQAEMQRRRAIQESWE